MNVAIITARAGSSRMPGKHTAVVGGRRVIEYPLLAALGAAGVGTTFLSTNDHELAAIARELGARVLRRPDSLCTDGSTQAAALTYSVAVLDDELDITNVVALLGNSIMVGPHDIDRCLALLEEHPEADSAMTVWQAEDDHPMRAMRLNADGYLEPYGGPVSATSNMQTYPTAWFHDQGVWAFRKRCVFEQQGPPPWTWMGRRCLPVPRSWSVGRDIDEPADLAVAEWWLGRSESAE